MNISDKFRNSEKGKKLPKPVRPWDLLKTDAPRATDEKLANAFLYVEVAQNYFQQGNVKSAAAL